MPIHPSILRYAETQNSKPPARLGQRYDTRKFLPEGGNTVVCHLDLDTPEHKAVLTARAQMQSLPDADRFLFTPISSLHMTLFEGALETRRKSDYWPAKIALDAPMHDVTETLLTRLRAIPLLPRFNARIIDIAPTGLTLAGATAEDETIMRANRDALTVPFGYRHPSHDAYSFHMTFAYPTGWISEAHLSTWHAAYHEILTELQAALPLIPLRPAAFCTFADMTDFQEMLPLSR